MKKVLLMGLIGVLAFGLGMAGVFFGLPLLAPEKAAATLQADSSRAAHRPLMTDSLVADSTRMEWPPDASAALLPTGQVTETIAATLRDSLALVREELEILRQSKDMLELRVEEMQHQLETLRSRRAEAKELSATLVKLEEKNLAALVAQLDLGVLEMLYAEASARNQSRLLQALPPGDAARFVQRLVQPEAPPPLPNTLVAPDTSNAASTTSETATAARRP